MNTNENHWLRITRWVVVVARPALAAGILVLTTTACGSAPAPAGTCSDLQGKWSFKFGDPCKITPTCTITQSGCTADLACDNGDSSTSSVSGNGFDFAFGLSTGGSLSCQGSSTGGKLSGACSGPGISCPLSGTLVSSPADDVGSVAVSDFVGATWNGTYTSSTTCAGTTTTSMSSGHLAFAAFGQGFGYTSSAGCIFEFAISGNTATLSNAPVSCAAASSDGATELFNYTAYTLTTSDGHSMTLALQGTKSVSGTDCSVNQTGTFTR